MKITVKGNFTVGRAKMKVAREDYVKQRNDLRKELWKKHKERHYSSRLESEIKRLDNLIKYYSISKTLPTKVLLDNGDFIVINRVVLQRFLDKLQGFEIKCVPDEVGLTIEYKNDKTKGKVMFMNMTKYFDGYHDLPVLEVPL